MDNVINSGNGRNGVMENIYSTRISEGRRIAIPASL